MANYDVMLECNRRKSEELENLAIETMRKMLEAREQITVATLVKATNCSRGFFYKNERVATEMRRLIALQGNDFHVKKKVVLEKVQGIRIAKLEKEIEELKMQVQSLTEENEKLKRVEKKREVDFFNEL